MVRSLSSIPGGWVVGEVGGTVVPSVGAVVGGRMHLPETNPSKLGAVG